MKKLPFRGWGLVHWFEAGVLDEFVGYVAYEVSSLGGVEFEDVSLLCEVALLEVDIIVSGVGDDVEIIELVAKV